MDLQTITTHVKFYRDLAWLAGKYGHSDLLRGTDMDQFLEKPEHPSSKVRAKAEDLPKDLQRMGPSFVKLGQLLSTRPDLIPTPYVKALARLQDECEWFPAEQSKEVISEELGASVYELFAEFKEEPIAAASLGQVHFARLMDGSPVAVKVERPGIRKEILEHLHILLNVAKFVDAHTEIGRRHNFHKMLREFRYSILHELDYRQEANHLLTIKENLKGFNRIVVPSPILDYTTSKVLTMEWIEGKEIDNLTPEELSNINGPEITNELFRAYLKQIFVDGIFHADPHPGNLFIVDTSKIALLDLGMVGRIPHHVQGKLLDLILAIAEGRGRDVADAAIAMGETMEGFDKEGFRRQLGQMIIGTRDAQLGDIQVGDIMNRVSEASGYAQIRLPSELTLLGKALLNLDYVGRRLDPNFNPAVCFQNNIWSIVRQRLMSGVSPWQILQRAIDIKDFTLEFPRKLSRIMELIARNELTFEVIDEKTLIEGFRNIANRLTTGVIIAAMILGASQLMRVPTPRYQLLGYPALAIVLFLGAAIAGVILVVGILLHSGTRGPKGS